MSKNKLVLIAMVAVLSSNFASVAEAREKVARRAAPSSPVVSDDARYSSSAPAARQQANIRFGAGVSTLQNLSGGAGVTNGLTGLLEISDLNLIQINLAFPSVSPAFGMTFGGFYKRTLSGNENTGFHAGSGITFSVAGGAGTTFSMGIPVLVGLHTTINDRIAFHFDGGPSLALNFTSPVTADFRLGGASVLLGASVAYMF